MATNHLRTGEDFPNILNISPARFFAPRLPQYGAAAFCDESRRGRGPRWKLMMSGKPGGSVHATWSIVGNSGWQWF